MTKSAQPRRRTASLRRSTAASMVALVRGEAPRVNDNPDQSADLVDAVRHHRIAPLAHIALRESSPAVSAELKADRDKALNVHVRATALLADLGPRLAGIPWAAFKGPLLSEFAHPHPGLRTYHDVDLLVSPHALRETTGRLLAAGWQLFDTRAMLQIPGGTPGEIHFRSPHGLLVDLHWTLLNQAAVRRRYCVHTDSLLDRRRTATVMATPVEALDPVDSFVHVCLHATESGANRLLFLLDMDQLARQVNSWDEVFDRAREWRVGPAVAVALQRARSVMRTPLPERTMEQLGASRAFRSFYAAADRLEPVPLVRHEASFARLVSRAARPGTGHTILATGEKALRWGRDRVTGASPRDWASGEPADFGSLDTYLRQVEREAVGSPERQTS